MSTSKTTSLAIARLTTKDGRFIGYVDIDHGDGPFPDVISSRELQGKTFVRNYSHHPGSIVYTEATFDWATNFRV